MNHSFPSTIDSQQRAWEQIGGKAASEPILEALNHHSQLAIASAKLSQRAAETAADISTELKDIAAEVAVSCAKLQKLFKPTADAAMGRSSSAAQEVFNIPELLENVLLSLRTSDLLRVQSFSKATDSIINTSPTLQRRLGLQASKGGHFWAPLATAPSESSSVNPLAQTYSSFPGIECCYAYRLAALERAQSTLSLRPRRLQDKHHEKRRDAENAAEVTVAFSTGPNGRLPVVGQRCRKMLVCQPSPTRVQVIYNCCPDLLAGRNNNFELNAPAPSGITVSDLYRAAQRVVEQHSLCMFADEFAMNENGYVDLRVEFMAEVKLHDDDPMLQPWRQNRKRMQAYRCAKEAGKFRISCELREPFLDMGLAFNAFEPIPTLAEWEATRPEREDV